MMNSPMPGNLMQMIQQIKANPITFLAQRRMNIPANIANDPNAILQHLLSTGQVNQSQVNQAYQALQQYK